MNIIQIFSTPIWNSEFPDFQNQKQSFLDCVAEYRKNNPDSGSRSNISGYESPMQLTNQPAFAPLFEFVAQMGMKANFDNQFVDCDVYITSAWANINDNRAAHNHEHVHNDTYSGVSSHFFLGPEDRIHLSMYHCERARDYVPLDCH